MTDLQDKFTALGTQLTTQHEELIAVLNAIAEALGAPPPGPGVTLSDVVSALTQSNTNTAGIRSDMASQQALLLTSVDGIFNNTELIIENNSVNARSILSAILANDPCKVCDASPILPPPLDVTPREIDTVHCQRMQALLYALLRFSTKVDIISSFGTGFSLTVIQDAFNEVLDELSNPSGLELPSFVEFTSLVAAIVSYVVSNVFESNSLPTSFDSINNELLEALYATSTADAGLAAYAGTINASPLDESIKFVLIRIGYSSLFNFYFDPANTIDLTDYDGSICVPDLGEIVDCTVFNSTPYTLSGVGTFEVIISPPSYSGNVIFTAGNFEGYSVRLVTNPDNIDIRVDHYNSGDGYASGVILNAIDSLTIYNEPTAAIGIHSDGPTASVFSIELCPPGPE